MDLVNITCVVVIYFAIPSSVLLFRAAFSQRKTPPRASNEVVQAKPAPFEEEIIRRSLHDIPIFENTGTILAINTKKRKTKSKSHKIN